MIPNGFTIIAPTRSGAQYDTVRFFVMIKLTPAKAAEITGAEVRGQLPEAEITFITWDSREAEHGCLFAALPGERVDGHDFIAAAAERGAVCALCARFTEAETPQLRVPDVQTALQQIAAWYRGLFDIPVVGITGSVGKTTAKEMIAAVLSVRFDTMRTDKNYNNELGVPMTLYGLRPEHQAAVVEMGISGFGEMTRLAAMVRPDIAVYTLIGDAHLEFLGSREGVLRAKGEMISGMGPEGVVIANGDDDLLRVHDFGRRTVLFGMGENCDVRAVEAEPVGDSAMRCVILAGDRRIPAVIPAFGRHVVYAALMGAAVGMELGLSDEEIREGIARFRIVGSRGGFIKTAELTIVDDCYNANPTSVKNSLESLSMLPGRHVAVLGDMFELGESGPARHREVGEYAAEKGILVAACGPLSENTAQGAGEGAAWFPDTDALIAGLPGLLRRGDTVLVKASHAMGFDAVTKALSGINGLER